MNNRGLKASRRIKITRKGWAILVAITLIVLAAAGIIAISILNADSPAKLSPLQTIVTVEMDSITLMAQSWF